MFIVGFRIHSIARKSISSNAHYYMLYLKFTYFNLLFSFFPQKPNTAVVI